MILRTTNELESRECHCQRFFEMRRIIAGISKLHAKLDFEACSEFWHAY
jgi:hypothetical protein